MSADQLGDLRDNLPTLDQIKEWACETFQSLFTVYVYADPEKEKVPKYLFQVWGEKGQKIITIRAEEEVFRYLCGAYMLFTGWHW